MNVTRRQFFRICAAGLGVVHRDDGLLADRGACRVRTFKLARATETRNTCPYCSVSCGVLIYSTGDRSKNATGGSSHRRRSGQSGEPRHLVSQRRRPARHGAERQPAEVAGGAQAGSSEWKRISWNDAIERIAKHMKPTAMPTSSPRTRTG